MKLRLRVLLSVLLLLGGSLSLEAAVGATHLSTSGSNTDATSYATASISPTANRLVLIAVTAGRATGSEATPTVSGAGMTWTQVIDKADTGVLRRITLFRALSASPGSGALTISFGAQTQDKCGWTIAEFDGIDTGGTNGANAIVQSASQETTTTTGMTVTLGAFSSVNNATYGAVRLAANSAVTPGSGFTELGENNLTENLTTESEWKATNDTSVDWTWSTASAVDLAVAVEIKASTGATTNCTDLLILGMGGCR